MTKAQAPQITGAAEAAFARGLPTLARKVAVVIPCYNEESTVAGVVRGFRAALPEAEIYVYDNNSTDATAARATEAGALVRREMRKGKGNVMRRAFADVDADIFIMVDGDDTYDAAVAPQLIKRLIDDQLDMIVGARRHENANAYRPGHQFGNAMLTGIVSAVFDARIDDMLSGYRVMSKRFVKSFPALSRGFEIETELTVHALEVGAGIADMPTPYKERPEGSASKLNTIRDGVRILRFIARLVRDERPLEFFSALAGVLALAGILLAIPVAAEYMQTGLVPRLPTWVLSVFLVMVGFLSLACGLILDTVTHGRREARRVAYLAFPAPR